MERVDIDRSGTILCLLNVSFDGLCQPVNPGGIACYAFLIKRQGAILHSEYGLAAEPFTKDSTNNVAEYTALVKSLEWLSENIGTKEQVRIISDSRLVVSQLGGEYKVKSKRLVPLYTKASSLRDTFSDIEIIWVPREENAEADGLTNKAYKETLKKGASSQSSRRF